MNRCHLKMYVWSQQPSFYAVAHAATVADARCRMIQEIGESGDGTCPERDKARRHVLLETPAIWTGPNAEFALTDSAEQIEMSEEDERKRKKIVFLQGELATVTQERDLLAAALESADHGYYCESTMKRVPENQRQCNCWKSKLDPVAILAAYDKALTGPLEARIAELERDVWSDPELLAHFFHDEYEKLAPAYDYETRKASAVAWADVPEKNKALMVAVCESAIKQRRDAAREAVSAWRPTT